VEYKYRVQYAHVNEDTEDVPGGIHHGTGTIEITTDQMIETQEHKDDVAAAIGRALSKTHNVTGVAIQAIVPLQTGHVVIDMQDEDADG
jgi:hypothetical protein